MDTEIWIVISTAAAVASACTAFGVYRASIKAVEQQLNHFRISVRPRLGLEPRTPEHRDGGLIRLTNHGVGPAIIRDLTLLVDGDSVENDAASWIEAFVRAGFPPECGATFRTMEPGDTLAAGESKDLITLPAPSMAHEYQVAFQRLGFEVRWESMYEERGYLRRTVDEMMRPSIRREFRTNVDRLKGQAI